MALLDTASPMPMMELAMADSDLMSEAMPEDEGMSDDEFESLVSREIEEAIDYIDSDIAPVREKATLYYRGSLFGDEEVGRSQVVSRDVHDTVNAILPSLMRVFFGPEKVVEFVPEGEEDVPMAEQATDYINYILTRDNPGYSILWDAFKDSLIRKQGIVKYFWDRSLVPSSVTYTGLDEMGILLLLRDLTQGQNQGQQASIDNVEQDENGFKVTVKLLKPVDKARIESVPNEELIIDRRAVSDRPGCFTLIGHRTLKTRSQLIAMGYAEDQIDEAGADDGGLGENIERQARMPLPQSVFGSEAGNEGQDARLYVEAFVYADRDGDGISELWRVCTLGTNHKMLHSEQVDDHNFAIFPCDPEPHTFFGDSIAEKVMDIQKQKSGLHRAMNDSFALSIFPRTAVKTQGVNLADVLNQEVGAVIRVDGNPQTDVYPFVTPDVSKGAFPMLAYMDEVRENRTGMSKVSQGLDPGALQNTTALAAANQFNKAHEHIEIIARTFAETGMKQLFRGLLRLTVENQRQQRMVQLRNKWIPVDPRAWKTNMDVTCNVALGAGTNKEKIMVLTGVAQKQEQQIALAGPNGPMVGLAELHNTYKEILALSGFKNANNYFREPDPNYQPPPPPPDPKVEIEMMKLQAETARADADRQADMIVRMAEISARYNTTIDAAHIKAQVDVLKVTADLAIQRSEAKNRPAKAAVN